MNYFIQAVAQAVLPDRFESSSVFELENLAEEHPYAAPLQLLLAARKRDSNDPSFNSQWQKTLLYFQNPLLLQHEFFRDDKAVPTGASSDKQQAAPDAAFHEEDHDRFVEAEVVDHHSEEINEAELPPIPQLKLEPLDAEKAAFVFTPYYTVDYFASQGIKLGDETKGTDRFGNQLRSFTDWLKEMRRLPNAATNIQLNRKTEAEIEKMAENSIHGSNEETAAMAEVWAKQGNKAKAIEIYKKLSLQIPSKRAYFAAKIEHLKK